MTRPAPWIPLTIFHSTDRRYPPLTAFGGAGLARVRQHPPGALTPDLGGSGRVEQRADEPEVRIPDEQSD